MTDIEYIMCGRVHKKSLWMEGMHKHTYHQLIVLDSGSILVSDEQGNEIKVKRGDCLFYPKGFFHEENQLGNQAIEIWHIGFIGDVEMGMTKFQDVDGRIRSMIRWVQNERDSVSSSLNVLNSFTQAIVAEVSRIKAIKADVPWVSEVQTFMHANLEKPLTVMDLASVAGHSKFHFIRAYKKAIGRTPMEDLRHIRIETAMRYLVETDMPLKTIAPRVGLMNIFHMSRLFKTVLKRSPSYYRKFRLRQKPVPEVI